MRIALIAATVATVAGLQLTAPVFAQKLPSEVEERMGIRPNSMNRDDGRRGRDQNYSRDYGRSYSYGGPTRYYRRDRGDSAAAGIAGFAAGAILGGALAQQQYQAAPVYVAPNQSAVAYCSQRFRSYDPRSGTYLGYDGFRHRCP